ncbi:MAG TPA: hypothetical protein PLY45_02940, partial [bacterium]|nr:hypothetical protein [bacterium]
VSPVGSALCESIRWPYKEFESEVLQTRCPQLSSFIYIPLYGFTHCCSSLFFRSPYELRKKLACPDIDLYLRTGFYRSMKRFSFGELSRMSGLDMAFEPQDSFVCELCKKVVSGCISHVDTETPLRFSV